MGDLLGDNGSYGNLGSGPDGNVSGGELDAAFDVIIDALASGSGLARLVAGDTTASEDAAVALLTGDSTDIPDQTLRLLRQSGNAVLVALASGDTYDDLATAVAALSA